MNSRLNVCAKEGETQAVYSKRYDPFGSQSAVRNNSQGHPGKKAVELTAVTGVASSQQPLITPGDRSWGLQEHTRGSPLACDFRAHRRKDVVIIILANLQGRNSWWLHISSVFSFYLFIYR